MFGIYEYSTWLPIGISLFLFWKKRENKDRVISLWTLLICIGISLACNGLLVFFYPSFASLQFIFFFFIQFFFLFWLGIIDFKTCLVPLFPLWFWIAISILWKICFFSFSFLQVMSNFLIIYGIGFCLYILSKKSFGLGDLYFLCGLSTLIEMNQLLSVLKFAIIWGGATALILLIFKQTNTKSVLPFLPFLSASVLLHIFYHPWLLL